MITALATAALAVVTIVLAIAALRSLKANTDAVAIQTQLLRLESEPVLVIEALPGLAEEAVGQWHTLDAVNGRLADGVQLSAMIHGENVALDGDSRAYFVNDPRKRFSWLPLRITNAGRAPAISCMIILSVKWATVEARPAPDGIATDHHEHSALQNIYIPAVPAQGQFSVGIINRLNYRFRLVSENSATYRPTTGELRSIQARSPLPMDLPASNV
jgi:hypothetical protein